MGVTWPVKSSLPPTSTEFVLTDPGIKEAALLPVLGKDFMDHLPEIFGTNYLPALDQLQVFAEAQNKLKRPDLSTEERAQFIEQSMDAVSMMKALTSQHFDVSYTFTKPMGEDQGEYTIVFGDRLSPLTISNFTTKAAQDCWQQIHGAFNESNQAMAMKTVDEMFSEPRTCAENCKNFADLAKLAASSSQDQFKLTLTKPTTKPGYLKITMSIGATIVPPAGTFPCETIFSAMLSTKKSVWNIATDVTAKPEMISAHVVESMRTAFIAENWSQPSTDLAAILKAQGTKLARSVTKLQASFRRHIVQGTKLSPKAWATVIRNSDGSAFLGKGGRPVYKIFGRLVEMPARLSGPARSGATKELTHRSEQFVGLTLHDRSIENEKNPLNRDFNTFNQAILKFIVDHGFKRIVPQVRVNETQLMSKNVGSDDLAHMTRDGSYHFSHHHFLEVAQELDLFHQAGHAHRDIKPENMAFSNGHVHLLDLDTAGSIGSFKNRVNVTTTAYIPLVLRGGYYNVEAMGGTQLNAGKTVDQYAFLSSMMIASKSGVLDGTGTYHQSEVDVFLAKLPCSDARKLALSNFFKSPVRHPLPEALSVYLTAPVEVAPTVVTPIPPTPSDLP